MKKIWLKRIELLLLFVLFGCIQYIGIVLFIFSAISKYYVELFFFGMIVLALLLAFIIYKISIKFFKDDFYKNVSISYLPLMLIVLVLGLFSYNEVDIGIFTSLYYGGLFSFTLYGLINLLYFIKNIIIRIRNKR